MLHAERVDYLSARNFEVKYFVNNLYKMCKKQPDLTWRTLRVLTGKVKSVYPKKTSKKCYFSQEKGANSI